MSDVCAACGEPVSYTDEGGCVGTDPAYHMRAECLLEACRREHAELEEARQLNARYRRALERIAHSTERQWCRDYAMCDHVGCEASHKHTEIARMALDVESSF